MGIVFTDEEIESGEVESVSAGTYRAEVSRVEFTKKGALQLAFKSAENGERLCFDWLYFSEKAKPYSARKLKALGLEKVNGKYELSDDAQELVGKLVTLTLVPDDNNPKYLTPNFNSSNHGYKKEEEADTPSDVPF
jgi:hypothetical protein